MDKARRKQLKAKYKRFKPRVRLNLPKNKRHSSKKDYKRVKKVDYDSDFEG